MRIPTIWYKHSEKIETDNYEVIDNVWQKNGTELRTYNFLGGSLSSLDEAKKNALKKRDVIRNKIEGKEDYRNPQEYDIDICEEIIATIDEKNVITRNRYGALVLNAEHLMIVDVDHNKARYRIPDFNIFRYLVSFFKQKKYSEGLLGHLEEALDKKAYHHLYTRIYQTPNGYRLILQGQKFNARSQESKKLMRRLYADWEYSNICYQQQCYRARLTPKPWRIKIKRPKIIFPFRTDEENLKHNAWVEQYQTKSEGYSACRLIREIGEKRKNKVVDYHDEFCKALSNLPMA